MSFWDHLPASARARLARLGRERRVEAGELVLRQGQEASEVLLVERGLLHVVDATARPVVVLAALEAGDVVGERGFLDGLPASADVRARAPTTCRSWSRAELQAALADDPTLGAAVWEAFARDGAVRARTQPADLRPTSGRQADDPTVSPLVQELRDALVDLEAAPATGPDRLARAFARVHVQLQRIDGGAARARVGHAARRALRADLAGSTLGALLYRREDRRVPPAAVAHALAGRAAGADAAGEALDAALLALPTVRALRARADAVARATHAAAPLGDAAEAPWVRVSLSEGATTARFMALARHPRRWTHQTDPRSTLASLGAGGVAPANAGMIVLDGVLDGIPARLRAGLLARQVSSLVPGGVLVVGALTPSPDALAWRHLLDWPALRIGPAALADQLHRLGASSVVVQHDADHAAVITARAGEASSP